MFWIVLVTIVAGCARDEPAVVDRAGGVEWLHPGTEPVLRRLFAAALPGTPVTIRP
jgi:hypothetical protein